MLGLPLRRGHLGSAVGSLVLGLLGSACSPADPEAERVLFELERLAFVPATAASLEGSRGPWANYSLDRAILVDRFEVTRGDWLHYFPDERNPQGFARRVAGFEGQQLEWPAYLSQVQAAELAERRGMRLMSSREWIHVALGRRSYPYPWGTERRASVGNTLELGLGTPAPVGTFENGRSQPFGCYDMLGNVWEWVSDSAPGYSELAGSSELWLDQDPGGIGEGEREREPPLGTEGDGLVSAFGGAFTSRGRRTFAGKNPRFHCLIMDRATVSPSLGVRHAADAAGFLLERAPQLQGCTGAKERLRAVGARWAATSGPEFVLPFLEELLGQGPTQTALVWLAEGAREE